MTVICIYPLPQFFQVFDQRTQIYMFIFFLGSFGLRITRARNINPSFRHLLGGRLYDIMKTGQQEYAVLSELYGWKPSIDKLRRTLLGSLANSRSKHSKACQASASAGCDIISESSLSYIPSLCHLISCTISLHMNNHFSIGVKGM
jgi:hypothetical protein